MANQLNDLSEGGLVTSVARNESTDLVESERKDDAKPMRKQKQVWKPVARKNGKQLQLDVIKKDDGKHFSDRPDEVSGGFEIRNNSGLSAFSPAGLDLRSTMCYHGRVRLSEILVPIPSIKFVPEKQILVKMVPYLHMLPYQYVLKICLLEVHRLRTTILNGMVRNEFNFLSCDYHQMKKKDEKTEQKCQLCDETDQFIMWTDSRSLSCEHNASLSCKRGYAMLANIMDPRTYYKAWADNLEIWYAKFISANRNRKLLVNLGLSADRDPIHWSFRAIELIFKDVIMQTHGYATRIAQSHTTRLMFEQWVPISWTMIMFSHVTSFIWNCGGTTNGFLKNIKMLKSPFFSPWYISVLSLDEIDMILSGRVTTERINETNGQLTPFVVNPEIMDVIDRVIENSFQTGMSFCLYTQKSYEARISRSSYFPKRVLSLQLLELGERVIKTDFRECSTDVVNSLSIMQRKMRGIAIGRIPMTTELGSLFFLCKMTVEDVDHYSRLMISLRNMAYWTSAGVSRVLYPNNNNELCTDFEIMNASVNTNVVGRSVNYITAKFRKTMTTEIIEALTEGDEFCAFCDPSFKHNSDVVLCSVFGRVIIHTRWRTAAMTATPVLRGMSVDKCPVITNAFQTLYKFGTRLIVYLKGIHSELPVLNKLVYYLYRALIDGWPNNLTPIGQSIGIYVEHTLESMWIKPNGELGPSWEKKISKMTDEVLETDAEVSENIPSSTKLIVHSLDIEKGKCWEHFHAHIFVPISIEKSILREMLTGKEVSADNSSSPNDVTIWKGVFNFLPVRSLNETSFLSIEMDALDWDIIIETVALVKSLIRSQTELVTNSELLRNFYCQRGDPYGMHKVMFGLIIGAMNALLDSCGFTTAIDEFMIKMRIRDRMGHLTPMNDLDTVKMIFPIALMLVIENRYACYAMMYATNTGKSIIVIPSYKRTVVQQRWPKGYYTFLSPEEVENRIEMETKNFLMNCNASPTTDGIFWMSNFVAFRQTIQWMYGMNSIPFEDITRLSGAVSKRYNGNEKINGMRISDAVKNFFKMFM